jgi:hypothetical protein
MFANKQLNSDAAAEFRDKSVRPAPLVSVPVAQHSPEAPKVVYPNQPSQRSQ